MKHFWLSLTVAALLFHVESAGAGSSKSKVIDFEDELVEGVNKRPLDSVSQLSEKEKRRRKRHLYRKRASYRTENLHTLAEMRLAQ